MTYDTPAPARPSARTSTGAIEAAPSESNAVLAVDAHGLVKTFGTNRAVDGIDLAVREGEILGVLGQGGGADQEDGQPVVEVGAEGARLGVLG